MIIVKNTTSNPPRSRGRPRAFDRSAALAIAGKTFWQFGYEGASIAELTAAMGITPQSLYAAFTSKADLYREALDWYQSEVGAFAVAALQEEDVVAAFEQLLMEAAKQFCRPDRPRGCMISTAVLTCARDNDAIADMVAQERAATMNALRDRIEQGISQGQLSVDTNVAALARFVGAIIQGMSVQARDGATEKDLKAVVELVIDQIGRFRTLPVTT
ncbi:TetR/AcrR family transcriptional regulator [Halomonas sp. ATBC28]|nr:TetR/AcrR family transcriptional regulator [Halomonas titanicae]TMU17648.1 TetR/AcrR family transcriptional regulator [Halomonas sp. ATBC28]